MFTLKYQELVGVEFLNEYYTNKRYRSNQISPLSDFVIFPEIQSIQTMKRLGMIFREDVNGFSLLCQVKADNKTLVKAIKADDKLVFLIQIKNPSVLGFSEVPEYSSEQVFYFSNAITPPSPNLHLNTSTSLNDNDKIKFRPTQFVIGKAGNLKLKSLDNGKEVLPIRSQKDTANTHFYFDLTREVAGKYQIFENGTGTTDIFYYAPEFSQTRFFGVIELFFNGAVNPSYQLFKADGTIQPRSYKIQLESKNINWKYFVEKISDNISDINISATPSFIRIGTEDNFISSSAIKLSEKPLMGITLTYKLDSKPITRNNLPNPDPLKIKKEAGNLYANIFLTI